MHACMYACMYDVYMCILNIQNIYIYNLMQISLYIIRIYICYIHTHTSTTSCCQARFPEQPGYALLGCRAADPPGRKAARSYQHPKGPGITVDDRNPASPNMITICFNCYEGLVYEVMQGFLSSTEVPVSGLLVRNSNEVRRIQKPYYLPCIIIAVAS